MKKKIQVILIVLVFALIVTSCASQTNYKDGKYSAEMSQAFADENGHGWQSYMTATVKDGVVMDINYDSRSGDQLKSETTAETYPMTPHPTEWIPQLNENLSKAKTAKDVEAVSGATHASDEAKALYAAILKAAAEGNTTTVVLDDTTL